MKFAIFVWFSLIIRIGFALKLGFVGDSNTVGQNNTSWTPGGYRWLLEQRLNFQSLGYSASNPATGQVQIWHDAFSGFQVDAGNGKPGLRDRLFTLFGGGIPDVCLLWAGLNDAKNGWSLSDLPERITSFAQQIRMVYGCRVLIIQLPKSLDSTVADRVEKVNKRLGSLVDTSKSKKTPIKFFPITFSNPDFIDAWHLNSAGYTKLAEKLAVELSTN